MITHNFCDPFGLQKPCLGCRLVYNKKFYQLFLIHDVPTGTTETLLDEKNQPLFKRPNLEQYHGIKDIKDNLKSLI